MNFRKTRLAMAIALSSLTLAACSSSNNDSSADDQAVPALQRLATVPLGAEITGMFLTDAGDFFFNTQHPSDSNIAPWNRAAIGVLKDTDLSALAQNFGALSVASSDAEKQSVRSAAGEFQIIAQEGDTFGGALPFGLGTIVAADGVTEIKSSNDPDFNAFVATNADSSEGYLFTNWEDRPGSMSRLQLRKNEDGNWSVLDALNIDFASVQGTWVNCFGTLSPWGTPLSAEELYFDNTADWNNPDYTYHSSNQTLADYLGGTYPNPYRYGYIVEITDAQAATPTPVKLFTLGRFSHENAVVMPDNRTVYLSDDGTDVVFFKFVADTAGDLSAGTLYAARVSQDAGSDPASTGFDVSWIELGHASNAELEGWIAEYDGISVADYVAGGNSYISDADIADWAAGNTTDARVAFLESRKAAAARGATAEFRKMEGVNIHYASAADGSVPYAYLAMSEVSKGMSDSAGDIQLEENKCGVVYEMPLTASYDIERMEPVLAGGAYDANAADNRCDVDGISNPDNLVILPDGRVLVGEDTGNHENNALWVWNPDGV